MVLEPTLFIDLQCDICFTKLTFSKQSSEEFWFSDDDQEALEYKAIDRAELCGWRINYHDEDCAEIERILCPICVEKVDKGEISEVKYINADLRSGNPKRHFKTRRAARSRY